VSSLFAFRESQLKHLVEHVERVINAQDMPRWAQLWSRLGAIRPVQYLTGTLRMDFIHYELDIALDETHPPQPGSKEHKRLVRFIVWSQAIQRVELAESKWHVHFPELPSTFPELNLSESEEYYALGDLVFTNGAMPDGLETLDEYPDVTTNWIPLDSVQHLCALERNERLLQEVSKHPARTTFARDFAALKSMLEMSEQIGCSVYWWAPGT
jgi:hypothetical protein